MREVSQDAYVDAGKLGNQGPTPGRALTLIDKLYREGAITPEMWLAGLDIRNMVLKEWPKSDGVSSYGDSKGSDPAAKSDRVGKRLTGFQIGPDGSLLVAGRRKSRTNERHLEDAIFAVAGLHDNEGNKLWDKQQAELLLRIVTHSETMPTLTAITLELTSYYGAKSKQAPPYALGVIVTLLGRAAQHLRYNK